MKIKIKRYITDGIYDLRLKYTTVALGFAEDALRPAERQRKLRKNLLRPREGSLRSEEGPFISTADPIRQTEGLFRPAKGLVR